MLDLSSTLAVTPCVKVGRNLNGEMLNLNLETLILSKTIIFVIYNLYKEAKKTLGFLSM